MEQYFVDQDKRLRVYVGMRNSSPFFTETLKQMASEGVKNALGFILSSHRTEASWERYQTNITDARAERSQHKVLVKAYHRLRPQAVNHIGDAMPRLADLIAKHAS